MLKPKLLVAISLLPTLFSSAADRKYKQPKARQQKEKISFTAFAYTSNGLTAEGRKPVAGKVIAADPAVLPMGTRVRMSGAGPWSGEYRVGDVGADIKGRKIDVFVPSLMEAREFGRRRVKITVLSVPAPRTARARRTMPTRCSGCSNSRSEAMMMVDEARQSSVDTAGSSVEAGSAGSGVGRSDSGEGRGNPALARLSLVQRTSAN